MLNIFIWLIYKTLSGATSSGQSVLGIDGIEGVLRVLKAPALLSISLLSVISRTLVGGYYPSAVKQSMHFTIPADWAKKRLEVPDR